MDNSLQRLSVLLYENDPMGTCCKENECFDEYEFIASETLNLINDGKSFTEALQAVLSIMFSEDMAIDVDYELLKAQLKK